MTRLLFFLRNLIQTFGGLILYWIALALLGVKAAIAVSLLFLLLDGGRRILTHRPIPPLWLVGNGAAVLFGLIDLCARAPFMLRYEGAILNLGWAAAFLVGAMGKVPLVLHVARQHASDIPDRPEVIRFFRAFTLAWSLFFVIRAAALLWIMAHYPLAQAIAIRASFGWISMGAMVLVSIRGRQVFRLCQRLGLFLPAPE